MTLMASKAFQQLEAAFGLCILAAIPGVFLDKAFPAYHELSLWILKLYFWLFVIGVLGASVIVPGYYVFRELSPFIFDEHVSLLEKRLGQIWAVGAGVLVSATMAAVVAAILLGEIAHVKRWFVGLLMGLATVVWAVLGFAVRSVIRAFRRARARRA